MGIEEWSHTKFSLVTVVVKFVELVLLVLVLTNECLIINCVFLHSWPQ